MDELRMRQPNYHARIHKDSPERYRDAVYKILSAGSNSPALYNDDVIIKTMTRHGYAAADARNYTAVGCVEPVSQGKSFSSTDAAIFNVPLMLELALNEGRRFGSPVRSGVRTKPASAMSSLPGRDRRLCRPALVRAFAPDCRPSGRGARQPPAITPRRSRACSLTAASRRASVQRRAARVTTFRASSASGRATSGDALAAIEQAVFIDKKLTLRELVSPPEGRPRRRADAGLPEVASQVRKRHQIGRRQDGLGGRYLYRYPAPPYEHPRGRLCSRPLLGDRP